MIVQDFSIDGYGWYVRVFYSPTIEDIDDVIEDLNILGCEEEDILNVYFSIESERKNDASTHSNLIERRSVIILGDTDSAEEFSNTLAHEVGHLAAHISIADNINPFGEEIQYLVGNITQQMFKVSELFLCDNCRKKHLNS